MTTTSRSEAARCAFIVGDPRGRHHCCQAPAVAGSAYCAEHHALTHVPRGTPEEQREIARLATYARNRQIGRDVPHLIPQIPAF